MSDPPRFDLREEPWIPVRLSGRTERVGLRELFTRAHEIDDLALPVPPAASGLMRILYVIAARIVGLDDPGLDDQAEDGWEDHRQEVLARQATDGFGEDAVGAYFDDPELADRWYLLGGPRPFLQDPRLSEQCEKRAGVNKLVFGRAAGNNPVWYGPFADTVPGLLPAADAAWHLIAQHYYGPSGRCSVRKVNGASVPSGTAGPLRAAISFHPLGTSLFESLVAGIPRFEQETQETDILAPWEAELPDPGDVLAPVTWLAGLLTRRSRHAVLLVPSGDEHVADAYVTWATQRPMLAARDPYVVFNMSKTGGPPYARKADAARALWRDLDALVLKGGDGLGFQRPDIIDACLGLPRTITVRMRVRAYGFDQDGQQVDRSWFTAVTPPLLGWLEENDPAAAKRISDCCQAAERVGNKLEFAARLAWAEAVSPPPPDGKQVKLDSKKPGPWKSSTSAAYWPSAERIFWELVADSKPEPFAAFVRVAEDALHTAVGGAQSNQRAARAVSHAIGVLRTVLPDRPDKPRRSDKPAVPARRAA